MEVMSVWAEKEWKLQRDNEKLSHVPGLILIFSEVIIAPSHCFTVNVIISDIIGETWIPHMKKTTLSCQITGFRPKDIHITLHLKRRNEMKKHLIHSWPSMDRPSDGNNTMLPVEMEVEMTETEDGSYKCDCRMSLTPNIDTDDGTVLILEVTHAAMRWPRYRYRALNVIKGEIWLSVHE